MENPEFKKICRLAGEACVKYRLIADGDRIMVGVSGGKDSFILMHTLEHLQRHAPVKFSLCAATFDPGFEDFDTGAIADYCRKQQWEHHTVKLNIPQIISEKKMERSPCVLCSRLRRGKLYGLAGELNCNKLALGQHLDDVISSFFMSICRGQGISSMAPMVKPQNPAHPVLIRPLALVPEELIIRCAATAGLPAGAGKCRYQRTVDGGDRAEFSRLIADLAEKIPDLRGNITHSLTKLEKDHLLLLPEDDSLLS